MLALTFSDQVKLILKRKKMSIKLLAEQIEEKTGKKMSRQNLTQKLARNNFQEEDMRLIAEVLGCKYQLSIMEELTVGETSTVVNQAFMDAMNQAAKVGGLTGVDSGESKGLALTIEEKMEEEILKIQAEEKAAAEAARKKAAKKEEAKVALAATKKAEEEAKEVALKKAQEEAAVLEAEKLALKHEKEEEAERERAALEAEKLAAKHEEEEAIKLAAEESERAAAEADKANKKTKGNKKNKKSDELADFVQLSFTESGEVEETAANVVVPEQVVKAAQVMGDQKSTDVSEKTNPSLVGEIVEIPKLELKAEVTEEAQAKAKEAKADEPKVEAKESAKADKPKVEAKESAKADKPKVEAKESAKADEPKVEAKESAKADKPKVEAKEPAKADEPKVEAKESAKADEPQIDIKAPVKVNEASKSVEKEVTKQDADSKNKADINAMEDAKSATKVVIPQPIAKAEEKPAARFTGKVVSNKKPEIETKASKFSFFKGLSRREGGEIKPDINPFTGVEYKTNSVRTHPKKVGYVQVYDRKDHKWADMTEWAFIAFQERKLSLLGKKYEEPTYLD